MRIGLLTGGGDAPGLNGIIEACVRTLRGQGVEVLGILDGFEGVFENRTISLHELQVQNAHALAGTLLGASNKSRIAGREKEFTEKLSRLQLDGLVACGGDGTFSALSRVLGSFPLIGVPKTIDNDLAGTDVTFGFDTACTVVAESVDALRFTAEAHQRLFFIETMGRTAGWMALGGGLAAYADAILIPERPFSRPDFIEFLKERKKFQRGCVVAVSEGATAEGENPHIAFEVEGSPQKERFGGVAAALARWAEKETGWEARHVVLGHLQRSRAPTVFDRLLTLQLGVEAARMALEKDWGKAAVSRGGKVVRAPIQDLMQDPRLVNSDHLWVKLAQSLGMFI